MKTREFWVFLVVGLIGGFLSGFAGIGGGVVLIPLMVGLLGVSQHQAHGTSLAIIIPTAVFSVTQYYLRPAGSQSEGVPPSDLAVAYALTAIVGAPIGAKLITYVNPRNLRQLFGLLLLSLAIGSLTRKTPLEAVGNFVLVVGLLALVVGTLVIAARQRRGATPAPATPAAGVAR